MKAYIAGAIQGRENDQDYRKVLKDFLGQKGLTYYDPWEDEAIYYKEPDYPTAVYLSTKDKKMVQSCDLIIAMFEQCSVGTTREVEWAIQAEKRVIIICTMPNPSPHLISMSKERYSSIQEFCKDAVF